MSPAFTRDEAHALALDVHAARPQWDTRGILTAIARVADRPLAAVRAAALAAARDPRCKTPAVIALEGDHWHTPDPTPARPAQCPTHDLAQPCRSCRADALADGTEPPSHAARPHHPEPDGVPMPDRVRALIPRKDQP